MTAPRDPSLRSLEERLRRIESRLVQVMLKLGIDPYERMYEKFRDKPPKA